MTELRADYVSDDVRQLNPHVFDESEQLSIAVAGGQPGQWRAGEEAFVRLFSVASVEDLEREYRFDDVRRWRFDFAHPETRIAVEIDGGVWTQGRHTRGQGFIDDCEKLNAAAAAGWRVFRFPADRVCLDDAELVAAAIDQTLGQKVDDE